VDEFKGAHAGLVLAEIELTCPSEQFDLPDWIGSEVTGDERYSNSVLAETGGPLARLSRPSMLAEG
jgi:CYTH domain-containing protein